MQIIRKRFIVFPEDKTIINLDEVRSIYENKNTGHIEVKFKRLGSNVAILKHVKFDQLVKILKGNQP